MTRLNRTAMRTLKRITITMQNMIRHTTIMTMKTNIIMRSHRISVRTNRLGR